MLNDLELACCGHCTRLRGLYRPQRAENLTFVYLPLDRGLPLSTLKAEARDTGGRRYGCVCQKCVDGLRSWCRRLGVVLREI